MTDTYIDPFETVTYGQLACEQMEKLLLPLHADWKKAVRRGVALQTDRNDRMTELLSHLKAPKLDQEAIADARDTIVRFGSWLQSLKGEPIDPALFFGNDAPSIVARRRLSKLAGRLQQMVEALTPFTTGDGKVDGAASRLAELTEARDAMVQMREAQRTAQADQRTYTPEIERARDAWLATYVANKRLAEGILRHHDKLSLLSLIFDDLAEVQISSGSSTEDLAGLTTGSADAAAGDGGPANGGAADANAGGDGTGGAPENSGGVGNG